MRTGGLESRIETGVTVREGSGDALNPRGTGINDGEGVCPSEDADLL